METMHRKKVLAISGSTRKDSSNLQIIKVIARLGAGRLDMDIFQELDGLPHFNPDLDKDDVPPAVTAFRNRISAADGVLICTPEYVFSLPGSLKNAIEWTVSTTVFSGKPVALITASSQGEKAHEALQLVMRTIEARFTSQTQLLIQGPRAKVNANGDVTDKTLLRELEELVTAFGKELNLPDQ
jgi:NAD(P)H-dependent FMN reductase